jgi:hypothetical protein
MDQVVVLREAGLGAALASHDFRSWFAVELQLAADHCERVEVPAPPPRRASLVAALRELSKALQDHPEPLGDETREQRRRDREEERDMDGGLHQ